MKVYCDNGAYRKELRPLQEAGAADLFMFKYENKNRNVPNSGLPSKLQWRDLKNYTWDTIPAGRWDDFSGSEKFDQIVAIVGLANHRVDILHLDSAYKSGCEVFLTNDKGDIWSKKEELEPLLGMRIFNTEEIEECIAYIRRR